MKVLAYVAVMTCLAGCGPDRNLIMDTKLDAPLRQKLAALMNSEQSEGLMVIGRCAEMIDGPMRAELIDAGAEILSMDGDLFTARVSSDDVLSVASLEFVTQVELSQTLQPRVR